MAKVIGLVGSPRKGGNTDTLVKAVLAGAAAQEADTEIHYLNDLDIRGCQGCDTCKETRACVLDDDMKVLYTAVAEADGIVIGSPIYACYFSAQTKLFVDRLYACFDQNLVSWLPKGKRFALVVTYADQGDAVYDGAVDSLVPVIELTSPESVETLVLSGTTDKGSAARNPEIMQRAEALGRRLGRSTQGNGA